MANKKVFEFAKGCKYDFVNNTIVMNKTFAKEAIVPGTPENRTLAKMKNQFPEFSVITKSARIQKKARPDKGLTFAKMELYIRTFQNSEELLKTFELVKARGRITASSKKYVTDWFLTQFPNYKTACGFDYIDNSNLIVLPAPAPEVEKYKLKEKALTEAAEG